jgi:hypothetical protein
MTSHTDPPESEQNLQNNIALAAERRLRAVRWIAARLLIDSGADIRRVASDELLALIGDKQ